MRAGTMGRRLSMELRESRSAFQQASANRNQMAAVHTVSSVSLVLFESEPVAFDRLEKGPSCNGHLLSICRRWCALSVATGIKVRVRWIPSEWNLSDRDSRLWECKEGVAGEGKEG